MLLPLVLAFVACTDDAPAVPDDSSPRDSARSTVGESASPVRTGWDERAGPVLLVSGEQPDEVLVVIPALQGDTQADSLDVSEYSGAVATLFNRHGEAGAATLAEGPGADPESATCTPWPTLAATGARSPWTVGFIGATPTPLPLDSLHHLAAQDSVRLVAEVARLASAAPTTREGDQAEVFRGLPFDVREARTLRDGDRQVLIAHVVRRVNQEANPLEEHTLLVAERTAGPWETTYTDRVVGHEESVARQELLAAVTLSGSPVLVLAHEGGEGTTYSLLRRSGTGWRTAWRSARSRC